MRLFGLKMPCYTNPYPSLASIRGNGTRRCLIFFTLPKLSLRHICEPTLWPQTPNHFGEYYVTSLFRFEGTPTHKTLLSKKMRLSTWMPVSPSHDIWQRVVAGKTWNPTVVSILQVHWSPAFCFLRERSCPNKVGRAQYLQLLLVNRLQLFPPFQLFRLFRV